MVTKNTEKMDEKSNPAKLKLKLLLFSLLFHLFLLNVLNKFIFRCKRAHRKVIEVITILPVSTLLFFNFWTSTLHKTSWIFAFVQLFLHRFFCAASIFFSHGKFMQFYSGRQRVSVSLLSLNKNIQNNNKKKQKDNERQ